MMNKYTGTKEVLAKSMSRAEYREYRGCAVPDPESQNPLDEGYLVEYLDSPNGNHPSHSNYVSWSPKDVFERAYKPSQTPLERVTAERAELMEKIDKLESFLDSAASKQLPLEQVELLRKQSKFMDSYSDILSMRMDLMRKHEADIN